MSPRLLGRTRRSAAAADMIDLDDIQGNILRPYRGCEVATYLFVRVVDPGSARAWLTELTDQVTTARRQRASEDRGEPCTLAVNLAFTYRGLQRLGVPKSRLAALPRAYREGMAARAGALGDPTDRDGRPIGWHAPFGHGAEVDLMVVVMGAREEVARKVSELEAGWWQSGVVESERALQVAPTNSATETSGPGIEPLPGRLEAHRIGTSASEHFGFRDGIAQPAIAGVDDDVVVGRGQPLPDGTWRPLQPGEFVMGLPAEDGVVDETAPGLTRNGSYLVLRKLEQDVALFHEMVEQAAARSALDHEQVRAKMMGRWSDGRPIAVGSTSDSADTERLGRSRRELNDFDFSDDDGQGCPVGAHIRRANPRGSLAFHGALENRRRLIRRGMPYGPTLEEDASAERGLVFACYQADIEGQFEFVQSQWLCDGNTFALGADRDPVVADPQGGSQLMRFEGSGGDSPQPPVFVDTVARCVISRGGEYFLVPGLTALRRLVRAPITSLDGASR